MLMLVEQFLVLIEINEAHVHEVGHVSSTFQRPLELVHFLQVADSLHVRLVQLGSGQRRGWLSSRDVH